MLQRTCLSGYRIARGELVSLRGIRSSTFLVRLAADGQRSRQKELAVAERIARGVLAFDQGQT